MTGGSGGWVEILRFAQNDNGVDVENDNGEDA
jgi:hypothetical protein